MMQKIRYNKCASLFTVTLLKSISFILEQNYKYKRIPPHIGKQKNDEEMSR